MTESKELFRHEPYYITAEYNYADKAFCCLFINDKRVKNGKVKEKIVYKEKNSNWGKDIKKEFELLIADILERAGSKQQFENIINHIQQS